MGIESAQYVNQLVPANPLSTDSVSQADDHLRMIKSTLVATFPNLNAPVTATAEQLNNPIPAGAIIIWSGSVATIPLGYALCDGTQGTPDLRGSFILGAGDTTNGAAYGPGAVGGSATSGFGGSHTHTANNGTAALSATSVAVAAGIGTQVLSAVGDLGHTHTINEVGDHTHSVLPPYYALCFIMNL
jgi:hypothetical protein